MSKIGLIHKEKEINVRKCYDFEAILERVIELQGDIVADNEEIFVFFNEDEYNYDLHFRFGTITYVPSEVEEDPVELIDNDGCLEEGDGVFDLIAEAIKEALLIWEEEIQ